jgi:hypothetical protein
VTMQETVAFSFTGELHDLSNATPRRLVIGARLRSRRHPGDGKKKTWSATRADSLIRN